MKLIANLLITVCLITGALSAATAYMIPIDGNEEALVGMKLGADAGLAPKVTNPPVASITESDPEKVETRASGAAIVKGREALKPIMPKGTVLESDSIAALKTAGVPHVRVSSFEFMLWPHKFIFIASCVGLLAGAGIIRFTGKVEVEEGGTGTFEAAQVAFGAIDLALAELAEELPKMPESEARLHLIMEQLGELQTGAIPAFVDCRPALVKVLGLSGYAELMDRFAALERQINRAWSAAADAHEEEAADCLAKTTDLLTDTADKLKRG